MKKHCPNGEVCSQCGLYHEEQACATDIKHCVTCDEDGHLATDASCREKKKRRLQKNRDRVDRRSRSRSRRRTASSQPPPHCTEDFPNLTGTEIATEHQTAKSGSTKKDYATVASVSAVPQSDTVDQRIAAMRKIIDDASQQLKELLKQQATAQEKERAERKFQQQQEAPRQAQAPQHGKPPSQPRQQTPQRQQSRSPNPTKLDHCGGTPSTIVNDSVKRQKRRPSSPTLKRMDHYERILNTMVSNVQN